MQHKQDAVEKTAKHTIKLAKKKRYPGNQNVKLFAVEQVENIQITSEKKGRRLRPHSANRAQSNGPRVRVAQNPTSTS